MNKNILVLGAGKSTSYLIHRLLEQAAKHDWTVTVGDRDADLAAERVAGNSRGRAIHFDVGDAETRAKEIKKADLVVNMLPPGYDQLVAWDCVYHQAHLVTASYEDLAMKDMDYDAKRRGIIILNEMGLDPGIDHMSAVAALERIRSRGGKVTSFKSYGTGLPAPENVTNPLGYAITWNPRNVVMAGEKGATYLYSGKVKMVPYQEVFQRTWAVEIDGLGTFEAYPNRDSLYYKKLFGLDDAETMIRGTLRYPGWCETWLQIVRLGLPNETMRLPASGCLTYRDVTEMFLPVHMGDTKLEGRVADFLKIDPTGKIMQNLEWLGLFSETPIPTGAATVAEAMIDLLNNKLCLGPDERDMVVLRHEIEAVFDGDRERRETVTSTLVEYGQPAGAHGTGGTTAMSRTVGLPAAIATELVLSGELELTGCQLPIHPTIYPKVLDELKALGIEFTETITTATNS